MTWTFECQYSLKEANALIDMILAIRPFQIYLCDVETKVLHFNSWVVNPYSLPLLASEDLGSIGFNHLNGYGGWPITFLLHDNLIGEDVH